MFPSARRLFRSTACARASVSAPRLSPPNLKQNGAFEASAAGQELIGIVQEAATNNGDNYGRSSEKSERREESLEFKPNTFIPPSYLSREFHIRKTTRRRGGVPAFAGREARYNDVFWQLSIDPRFECENATLMSNFVTRMGKVQRRAETGLTQRSQRLLGKAIKRAKMMGIMPLFSRRYRRYNNDND